MSVLKIDAYMSVNHIKSCLKSFLQGKIVKYYVLNPLTDLQNWREIKINSKKSVVIKASKK